MNMLGEHYNKHGMGGFLSSNSEEKHNKQVIYGEEQEFCLI